MKSKRPNIALIDSYPVPFDVISEAIEVNGLPLPSKIERDGMAILWPNDETTATYTMVFSSKSVRDYCGLPFANRDGEIWKFRQDLRNCFADDVTLTELHLGTIEVWAKLYVKVERYDK